MNERGVTLIEMLVTLAIVAMVAGLSFPSIASAMSSINLRLAGENVQGFLHGLPSEARLHQSALEVFVTPSYLQARDLNGNERKRFDFPNGIRAQEGNSFILYPDSEPPAIRVELRDGRGRRISVSMDERYRSAGKSAP